MPYRCRLTTPSRRDQIIEAALHLFRTNGFANVSTRDISSHAGISRSHIYHYFSDWNELRREAFARFANEQLEQVRDAVEHMAPDEALAFFLSDCLPATDDDSWVLWLDAWDEAMHDAKLSVTYLAVNQQWQELLAGIVQRGVDVGTYQCEAPKRVARQLFALAMGYANDLMLLRSDAERSAMESELVEVAQLLLGSATPRD